MPIGDLLASITGEKPSTPSSLPNRPAPPPKRKADTDLPGSAAKTSRTIPTTNGSARPHSTQQSSASRVLDRPLASSSTNSNPSSVPARSSAKPGTSVITKNGHNTPSRPVTGQPVSNGSRPVPSTSAAKIRAAVGTEPKTEPKKRSFAEIMARAKAAQAMAPKPGTIQHKPIERGMTKRDRVEAKAVEARQAAKIARQGVVKRGTAAHGTNGSAKGANGKTPTGDARKDAPTQEEKKVKKAAIATTGYQGTARPRPGATSAKSTGLPSKSRGDSSGERDRPRYVGALSTGRRRDEEDDDDLDGFIEYDDDEEEPGYGLGAARRGVYYSDDEDESDMEAGLSDVEEEESRAARIALQEDRAEEARLRKLALDKEERKRRLMEASKRRA